MSPWLLGLFLAVELTAGLPAAAAPTELGPTSSQEAELLWKDGKDALQSGAYREAATALQRFIDRYPGQPGYLEAHRLLGVAYLELFERAPAKDPERRSFAAKARAPLKYYADGEKDRDRSAEGRLLWARAQLALGLFHESQLVALQLLQPRSSAKPLPPALEAEALLIKARALMGLQRDPDAELSLASARKILPASGEIRLKAEAAYLSLLLKSRACARLPSPGKMDEGQVRNQIVRRGNCVLELLPLYKGVLALHQERWDAYATRELATSFRGYLHACANPPSPPPLKPRDRTPEQRRKYREELVLLLQPECNEKRHAALNLLQESQEPKLDPATLADIERALQ